MTLEQSTCVHVWIDESRTDRRLPIPTFYCEECHVYGEFVTVEKTGANDNDS